MDGARPGPAPAALPSVIASPAGDAKSTKPGKFTLAQLETKVLGMRDGDRSNSREWKKILDSLSPNEIIPLLAALEKNPSRSVRDGLRSALLAKWAETDPGSAMNYANAVVGRNPHDQAILAVLRGWSENDPAAASNWVKQLPAGQLRNQALNVAIGALSQSSPELALEMIQMAGNSSRQYGYSYSVFGALADRDPASAAAKALELPGGAATFSSFECGCFTLGTEGPASGAGLGHRAGQRQ